ncbi:Gamma-glutamyl hydrolase [Apostasia shenzhenica]|uniref:folate gamma-glutamyl hydrolase n=1 Tax=Apostasia shenzhenica TaxID=1088818 RepID=A0A2I0BC46_9ASPA|nr:Gamma-glutamyl hydrolase [Apostasia shenzhenica]
MAFHDRPAMWRFLWILIALSTSTAAASAATQSILLPGEEGTEEGFLVESLSGQSCPSPDPLLYYQPVVGIVTHPGDGASGRLSNSTRASNIPASYVKFVESAGARVIPLIYNEPWDILSQKLELVNGVLFTGGWAKMGLYFDTIKKVFEETLSKNDAGDHFPLFGICLGFELISMIVSEDNYICEPFSARNQASSLQFANMSDIRGSVFERFPPELLRKLSTECLVMQNHRMGISPRRLQENGALSSFFKILSTSTDENNEVYVSTAQAYRYPVTCFQWHPEKNVFEWGSSLIPHTEDAVRVTQMVANYFISEARRSLRRPPAKKVRDNLIYNFVPTYGGKAGKGYDQVYVFE